jgi:hypothetical protein
MTLEDFKATLRDAAPPEVSAPLVALWHDGRGDWDRAHMVAQDIEGAAGAWVHAYLHRKEGDLANARYWYRHARQPEGTDSLESEWSRIVSALLG